MVAPTPVLSESQKAATIDKMARQLKGTAEKVIYEKLTPKQKARLYDKIERDSLHRAVTDVGIPSASRVDPLGPEMHLAITNVMFQNKKESSREFKAATKGVDDFQHYIKVKLNVDLQKSEFLEKELGGIVGPATDPQSFSKDEMAKLKHAQYVKTHSNSLEKVQQATLEKDALVKDHVEKYLKANPDHIQDQLKSPPVWSNDPNAGHPVYQEIERAARQLQEAIKGPVTTKPNETRSQPHSKTANGLPPMQPRGSTR